MYGYVANELLLKSDTTLPWSLVEMTRSLQYVLYGAAQRFYLQHPAYGYLRDLSHC